MNENLVVPIFDLLKGDRDSKQITKLVKKILVANRRNIKNRFNYKTSARESHQRRRTGKKTKLAHVD